MDAGMALKSVFSVAPAHAQATIAERLAGLPAPEDKNKTPPEHDPTALDREHRRAERPPDKTARDAIIDPETSEIVYRVRDTLTGQVLSQVPAQAALRMQAYARAKTACALAEGKNPFDAAQDAARHIDALT